MSTRRFQTYKGQQVDNAPGHSVASAAGEVVAAVKELAGAKIFGAYPDYKQSNMLAESGGHTYKVAAGGTLTSAEADRATYLQSVWAWVQAVREASDVIEDSVQEIAVDGGKTELERVQDILDIDVDAHVAWPGDPPIEP